MRDSDWKVTLLSPTPPCREALRRIKPVVDEHKKQQEEKKLTREVQHPHIRKRLLKYKRRVIGAYGGKLDPGLYLGSFLVPEGVDPSQVAEDLAEHLAELDLGEVPVTITPVDAEELEELPPGNRPSYPAVKLYMEEEVREPLRVIEATSSFLQEHYPVRKIEREGSTSRTAYIKKIGPETWRVYSEGGKNLGTYDSLEGAKNRLRQVHFFKRKKG